MRRPTRPYPTRTICPNKYFSSVTAGSSARGSAGRSSLRARAERDRIQTRNGSMLANNSGLMAIEIRAPARIRLRPSGGSNPNITPSPTKMNENSPIWVKLAETLNAVLNGIPKKAPMR